MIRRFLSFSAFAMIAIGATAATAASPAVSAPPAPAATGARAPTIAFQFAIYFLPSAGRDAMDSLREHLKSHPRLRLVDTVADEPGPPTLVARVLDDVAAQYAPPDPQMLQYFGRGLSREQAEALAHSKQVLVLDFGHASEHMLPALADASALVAEIARDTGGLIWDEQTRETFTLDEWTRRRVFDPAQGVPDVSTHLVTHAYPRGEAIRVITLGLSEFGVPDLVIADMAWSRNEPLGQLINLLAQTLAEGASVPLAGDYDFDLRSIRNEHIRAQQLAALSADASGVVKLHFGPAERDNGDPDNRLLALGFDRYTGADLHARQDAALLALFAWTQSRVRLPSDDAALGAESARERSRLPALRAQFNQGLPSGAVIELKAPFARPDGEREMMWVQVVSWNGKAIKGLLKNEPYAIPTLHAGAEVEVNEDEVFDYLLRHPDGSEEGNTTGAMIDKADRKQ
jgi:uncharacterized protein YegJ (DUF2314 family)